MTSSGQAASSGTHRGEASQTSESERFDVACSNGFTSWMIRAGVSVALTTYQSGKIFLLGTRTDGRLSVFERTLDKAMGMAVQGPEIHVSTAWQVWRFRNVLKQDQQHEGYDALYVPRESRVTGDVDIHDLAVDAGGRLVMVNTLFNCLATPDDEHSFRVLWKPPWISRLLPEDRCHLNGVAIRDGSARYVTSVSRSDVVDGWRDQRAAGGLVMDIETDSVVCTGLSMPHSPRWHEGHLWLLESGSGYLGRLDPVSGHFERLVFCPGYARGLAFAGRFAIVGLSDRRENRTFQDLPLEGNLVKHGAETRCGLLVIDTQSLTIAEWVRFSGPVRELYDVAVIKGIQRPMMVGFRGDEVRRILSFPSYEANGFQQGTAPPQGA